MTQIPESVAQWAHDRLTHARFDEMNRDLQCGLAVGAAWCVQGMEHRQGVTLLDRNKRITNDRTTWADWLAEGPLTAAMRLYVELNPGVKPDGAGAFWRPLAQEVYPTAVCEAPPADFVRGFAEGAIAAMTQVTVDGL